MKAQILQIGTFDEKGKPQDWFFDCKGQVVGIDIDFDKITGETIVKYGGYTIEELKEIAARQN